MTRFGFAGRLLTDRAKEAILGCLGEACGKTGSVVHAFVVMRTTTRILEDGPGFGTQVVAGRVLMAASQRRSTSDNHEKSLAGEAAGHEHSH